MLNNCPLTHPQARAASRGHHLVRRALFGGAARAAAGCALHVRLRQRPRRLRARLLQRGEGFRVQGFGLWVVGCAPPPGGLRLPCLSSPLGTCSGAWCVPHLCLHAAQRGQPPQAAGQARRSSGHSVDGEVCQGFFDLLRCSHAGLLCVACRGPTTRSGSSRPSWGRWASTRPGGTITRGLFRHGSSCPPFLRHQSLFTSWTHVPRPGLTMTLRAV